MTTSAPTTLPDTLGSLKRAAPSQPTGPSTKRQKGKKREDNVREAAVKALSKRWETKLEAVAAWRQDLSASVDPPFQQLVATLDHIRRADSRPLLTQTQKTLIPVSTELQKMLLDFFLHPLTWSSIKHSAMLLQKKLDDVELDEERPENEQDGSLAQFYIRKLKFVDHESVWKLLDQVKAVKPHYAAHIECLLKESYTLKGERWLSYGGFTVANTPVGRQIDDQDQAAQGIWGLMKTVLESYKGKFEIYEVPILRFSVGEGGHQSVIKSRGDLRTDLFESLMIDSLGFQCLNTAPAGTCRSSVILPRTSR